MRSSRFSSSNGMTFVSPRPAPSAGRGRSATRQRPASCAEGVAPSCPARPGHLRPRGTAATAMALKTARGFGTIGGKLRDLDPWITLQSFPSNCSASGSRFAISMARSMRRGQRRLDQRDHPSSKNSLQTPLCHTHSVDARRAHGHVRGPIRDSGANRSLVASRACILTAWSASSSASDGFCRWLWPVP